MRPGHPVRIQHARKHAIASERTVPIEHTLVRASRAAIRYGVTRVADITGLDRVGIPVYSAVVPKSDDLISVYSGKGVRPVESKAGALMEAIERQTALRAQLPTVEGSFNKLRRGKWAVADPQSFNHKLRHNYDEGHSYVWTEAIDLFTYEPVLVPAGLAAYGPRQGHKGSPFQENSTNGLASGNCLEEAVCHALCELIERDSHTLADLRSQWMRRARREAIFGAIAGAEGRDDPSAYPRFDLEGAGDPLVELLAKFTRVGLHPVVRDMTSDLGICSAIACVSDDSMVDFPQVHGGMGAHPNRRIAVTRALTELALSRAVDIQGAREDIIASDGIGNPSTRHTQRVRTIQLERWVLQQSGFCRPYREVASFESDDIADDIRLILSRLARRGIERALVVNLSEPGDFSVVRVVVPGLEFWSVDGGKLGTRAVQFWRQNVL